MGKTTQVSWGVIFPNVDMLLRHPSQIYEALLEGLLLFLYEFSSFKTKIQIRHLLVLILILGDI